jgi:Na+/H+ antiporter NhaD/arsenite permease-like protein
MVPVIWLLHKNSNILNDLNINTPFKMFWLVGIFSAFLDNAPTYMLFLNATGSSINELTSNLSGLLSSISAGAVYMGACTYIGNAPNFMVLSMAKNYKIKMPSFFGYMVWSIIFLLPIYMIMGFLCF